VFSAATIYCKKESFLLEVAFAIEEKNQASVNLRQRVCRVARRTFVRQHEETECVTI
jgi:hypothetical protein